MKIKACVASALLALLLPLGAAGDPAFVLVNPSLVFATIYVAVPAELPADAREALEIFILEHEGVYLEPWKSFLGNPRKHVAPRIRRNDYPEVDCVESLVQLLQNSELEEIGLTWNGGVAIGDEGYEFAEITFDVYTRDGSFVARPPLRAADPVHPWNHTAPRLNVRPTTGLRS